MNVIHNLSTGGYDNLSCDLSTPPRRRCLEPISVPPVASPEGSFETSVMVFTDDGIEVDVSAYGYAQGAEMEDGEEEGDDLHEHDENDDKNNGEASSSIDDGALELERRSREEALAETDEQTAENHEDECDDDADGARKDEDDAGARKDEDDADARKVGDADAGKDGKVDDDGFVRVKLSSGWCFLRNSDPPTDYSCDKI